MSDPEPTAPPPGGDPPLDAPPPLMGTWPRLYALLVGTLVAQIVLFWTLTRMYQ